MAVWLQRTTVLVLLVPALAFWPRAPLDAYAAPKLGLLALVLALAPWNERARGQARRPRGPVLALAAVLGVCAACAPDLAIVWFGSPQRGQGMFALLLCGLLFEWASRAPGDAQGVFHGAQLACLLVAGLALLQWLGVDPLRTGAPRPAATMGNPVLLGQWLVLVLPLCVCALRGAARPLFAWVVVLMGALALLASGSRGAWLGALTAVLALGASTVLRHRRTGWVLLAAGSGVLLWAAAMWRPASVEHRLQLWGAAVQVLSTPPAVLWPDGSIDRLAALRPWVGYGGDAQVMPMRLAMAGQAQFPADPDRAHNLLLDLLLRHGVLGALAFGYVALSLAVFLRRPTTLRIPLVGACAAGLSGWGLSLLTGFAGTADSLAASALAGFAVAASRRHPASGAPRQAAEPALRAALVVAAFGIWLLPPVWLPGHWRQPEQAVLAFEQARSLLHAARGSAGTQSCTTGAAAISALSRSTSLDPGRPEYRTALQASVAVWCSRCRLDAATSGLCNR